MMTTSDDQNRPGFTITRTLRAPIGRVWQAWTDPEHFHAWLQGMGTPRETVHTEVRVGGRYGYTMVNDETGERFPTGGVYLQIEEPRLLRFTWGDPGGAAERTAEVTVRLTERGAETELSFELRGFAGKPGDENVYDGWVQALGYLADSLTEPSATA